MSLRERLAFAVEAGRDLRHTGAVQPSSGALAQAMTEPLRAEPAPGRRPARILEIGPGTGAITRAIAAAMGPADHLQCYEINPTFARLLRERLRRDPALAPRAGQIEIRNAPAQELADPGPFDFVLCSAPLNNFDAPTLEALLDRALGVLGTAATFSYFEYVLLPALRGAVSWGEAGRRWADAQAVKRRRLLARRHRSVRVWRNLPPARVVHVGGPPG